MHILSLDLLPDHRIIEETYVGALHSTLPASMFKPMRYFLMAEMIGKNDLIRVCMSQDEPIGLMIGYQPSLTCNWLYVAPEHRRQGIATQLCEGLITAQIHKEEMLTSPMLNILGITHPIYFFDNQGDYGEFVYVTQKT